MDSRAIEQDALDRLTPLVREQRVALIGVARAEGLGAEEALECVQDALCTCLKPHQNVDPEHDLSAPSGGADALLEQAEALARLRVCVAELCSIQRSVVTLRLLEERSGEDVAALLGVARGHLDVLVHRARAALRACMQAAD